MGEVGEGIPVAIGGWVLTNERHNLVSGVCVCVCVCLCVCACMHAVAPCNVCVQRFVEETGCQYLSYTHCAWIVPHSWFYGYNISFHWPTLCVWRVACGVWRVACGV